MLFTSPVYSQASGSIAGITYSHGRGGMVTKARKTPTNPNSQRQRTIRYALGRLAPYWGEKLDAGQRDAWNLYAANVPWSNALGQTTFLTGHQHFIRCNGPRIQASIEILETAPTVYDLGTWTEPKIYLASDEPKLMLEVNVDDDWNKTTGGYLLCYAGKTIGPGHKFYRNPWRYCGKHAGVTSDPFLYAIFDVTWPWSADNIAWVYCRIIQVDGRMSFPIILGPETIIHWEEKKESSGPEPPTPTPPPTPEPPPPTPLTTPPVPPTP